MYYFQWQNRPCTHSLLDLHFYHHHSPCSMLKFQASKNLKSMYPRSLFSSFKGLSLILRSLLAPPEIQTSFQKVSQKFLKPTNLVIKAGQVCPTTTAFHHGRNLPSSLLDLLKGTAVFWTVTHNFRLGPARCDRSRGGALKPASHCVAFLYTSRRSCVALDVPCLFELSPREFSSRVNAASVLLSCATCPVRFQPLGCCTPANDDAAHIDLNVNRDETHDVPSIFPTKKRLARQHAGRGGRGGRGRRPGQRRGCPGRRSFETGSSSSFFHGRSIWIIFAAFPRCPSFAHLFQYLCPFS